MTRSELINIKIILKELISKTTVQFKDTVNPIVKINISYRLDKQHDAMISVLEELELTN